MPYAELLAKSNFSFLEGASHPEELVEQAVKIGLQGLGLVDLNGVYGAPKGFARAKQHPDFKYLVGAEFTLKGHPNIHVLALNRAGYGWMCRTLTAAHAGKEKGEAHLNWDEFLSASQNPLARQGWLVLPKPTKDGADLLATKWSELKDTFGDNLSLPLVRHQDGLDLRRTQQCVDLQRRFGVPIVASNDVRYHIKTRKILHDVLRSVQHGQPLEKCGHKLTSNGEHYLKSPTEMALLFKDMPHALSRTIDLAERCEFKMSELRYRYPSEWIPQGHTAQSYLEDLTFKGLRARYPGGASDHVMKQVHHELKLICDLHFADYFLTIYDIVDFARSKDILCQGRGSAANSVVCYCLGITSIDPIHMELLFERFISVERGEPPDIDVDFEHERREEVIQYIYEKYGRDRAAMVSAVITYKHRSSLREVAKALGVPVGTLSAKKVERDFDQLAASVKVPKLREKIDHLVGEMYGFPRHLSIHSGGFTLSADPIIDIVPVEPARMDGRTIIQWDKYDLDELGLLKVDILSLGMLSALKKCLDQVGMKFHEVPHDDPATYEMIRQVDTVGTFQIESRAQMSMLGRLQPKNFYDLVIEVAIVRPGPIVGQMVHPFLRRRRGLEKPVYYHPEVEKVLKKTLGVPLFQEQVMKLAMSLAGFTAGEADQLRRAIGAWRSEGDLLKIGERLMKGLLRSGLPHHFANQFFEQIKGFAHYGFPESHAASFALIAYVSCYMKCHYPAQFTVSLINSQPMGFYSNHTLINDVERHGVRTLPLDLNASQWDCQVLDMKTIRLGFRVVSGLSERAYDILNAAREKGGAFKSIEDFMDRTAFRREVYHRLALSGAFHLFGYSEREALWRVLEREIVPTHLLNVSNPGDGIFQPMDQLEHLQEDFRAYGLTTRGHPMRLLRERDRTLPRHTIHDVRQISVLPKRRVTAAGLVIIRQKPPTAKGVCFCTLEDETGFLDMTFWPDVYEKLKETLLNHAFLRVRGTLQKDENALNLLVDHIEPIFKDTNHLDQTPLPIEPQQWFY